MDSKQDILGVHFSYNFNWNLHVNTAINKANSLMYALRYLNTRLSGNQFRTLIHSHFLSRLTYACKVWSGSIGLNFKARKGRDQLLIDSGVISLRLTFIIRDAKLLHTFFTTMTPEPIIEQLLSYYNFIARRCNRLFFMIAISKRLAAAVLSTLQSTSLN